MPAIRDFAQNYNSSTSGLNFPCAAPDTVSGDLLIGMVSADTGSQLWHGGDPMGAYWNAYTGGTAFTDDTTDANSSTTADTYGCTDTASTLNDAVYFGHAQKFNSIQMLVSTAGAFSGAPTWVVEYWNGSAWTALTLITTGITPTAAIGLRLDSFVPPTNWATNSPGGAMPTLYYVRIRISVAGTITTRPVYTQAWVGLWQQLFSTTNTVNSGVIWKKAGASEPDEYNIAFTTAETANGAIISLRDIDPLLPFPTADIVTYASTNLDTDLPLGDGTNLGRGQSFTATASKMASVIFSLKKYGTPTGTAYAKLYTHSGTLGTSSVPTGVALAVSDAFDVSTLNTSYQSIEFTFSTWNYALTATNFVVTVEYSGGNASNYVQVGADTSTSSGTGNYSTLTGAWAATSTSDLIHTVKNFVYTTGTANAAKSNLPTLTTSRNNSLVLWSAANAGTSTTTLYLTAILEGACSMLFAKDGTGHSDACSWGFQATAGVTPTVGQSNMGTGTQTITTSVIAINPPSTGATVIPVYCASDASVYVSPLTGAAYNGDSVPATTITTPFTGTINGRPLAAGGSTVTRADTGINSYHAMVNFTGVTTSRSWGGIRQTILSRNLSSKNLLFHIQPYLPVDIQTTDSVALAGTMGVAIGLASSAGNFKVWHVGGANTPWGISRHIPAVIHTDYAGAGLIQTTGTLSASAVVDLGFMNSGKVVARNWLVGSLWALDTCVIAGGNSSEPINIPKIVASAADGHERKSVIQQGSSQMLVLGPIQIGDGGTNPSYLRLDATAVEFPQQYNQASKNVNYCSIDNVAGIIYYPGASDTITHKNSVISSASRFKWGLHASASTSAAYDFSGLSVIGAGTVTLARAVTITGLTINDYSTIDATELTLTYSTIKGCPTGNDSITLTAASNMDYNTIDVTGVSSGNRWCSVADPTIFSYCSFTGSASTGHAIRITTPGTYSIYGLTFSSFGADESTSAAIFNDSGGAVTLNVYDGGTTPTIKNGTSASTTVVSGIRTVTVSVTSISGAVTGANVYLQAASGGPFPYDATVTITRSGITAIVSHTSHGMATGDKIVLSGITDKIEDNATQTITYISANSYSYTTTNSGSTSYTGTIKCTFVFFKGTASSGAESNEISMSRSIPSNQPISGWARKSSGAPYYKQGAISGTVSSSGDTTFSPVLVSDD